MAEIKLTTKTEYQKSSFDPIKLSDGTVVTMESITDGDKRSMSGSAVKDSREVASFRISSDSNRLFMQVFPLDAVDGSVAVEIVSTFMAGAKLLLSDK